MTYVVGSQTSTNLHDELNWTNEVEQEFEDQVLLLLLHLIETILLAALLDLGGSKTSASVSLEKIFRDRASARASNGLLLIDSLIVTVLGLEVINQLINTGYVCQGVGAHPKTQDM
ncbi:hypothetical protein Q9L58_005467 [Maublancomyces gigas]|uniref:Uncharacterized protein n=1 Tax=Discina gigas TaxID=1032678 RepID=A0ABR3GI24_9PEZI